MVFDDFGEHLGRAWRETDEERTDWKTVITDLMDGQYSDPVRIVAFNTAEGWSRDGSEEIADEIAQRCGMDGFDVPPVLERFVEWHRSGQPRQLPLPLRGAAEMPIEFYQGRPLEPEELEGIRQQFEQFDTIEAIDPEMRGIVERNSKLPPEDE